MKFISKFFPLVLLITAFAITACGGGGGGGGGGTAPVTTDSSNATTSTSTTSGTTTTITSTTTSEGASTSGTSTTSGTQTTPSTSVLGIPVGFVTVAGSTVVGGDKFKVGDNTGCFVAGRTVTITTFFMSDHEVTQAEYQAVMGSNPSYFDGSSGKEVATGEIQANRPVETVSWYDALVYCNKKSMADGLTPCYTINGSTNPAVWGAVPTSSDATWNAATCNFNANGYRLPTEAEWEYAALGGSNGVSTADPTDYAGTNTESNIGNYAWYLTNSGVDSGTRTTHEVKKKAANSLGLYDMSGNVWEWCWDWYGSLDSSTAVTGASSDTYRINRGGSYRHSAENNCSVAFRNRCYPGRRYDYVGFRVVRTAN